MGFTRKELDETASEVDIAVGFAPSPSYKKRLEAVLGKLEDILDALERTSRSSPAARGAGKDDRIYQLKITLKDVKPPVWRRVLVPDCPLGGAPRGHPGRHGLAQLPHARVRRRREVLRADRRPRLGLGMDMEVEDEEG